MEQNKEIIDSAKIEQLTDEEMEAVAGGVDLGAFGRAARTAIETFNQRLAEKMNQ